MKVLKKANQKNIILNKSCYTLRDINTFLAFKEIFYFDKNSKPSYELLEWWQMEDIEFHIFTDSLCEIKVALDENGYYETVAIGKNGYVYHVEL